MVKTSYIVDKEKRTIVCIIKAADDFIQRARKYGVPLDHHLDFYEKYGGCKTYKGIAKCAPEDEWDETYGKRLAEYRASKAREKYVNRCIKEYSDKVMKNIVNLNKYGRIKTPRYPEHPDQL